MGHNCSLTEHDHDHLWRVLNVQVPGYLGPMFGAVAPGQVTLGLITLVSSVWSRSGGGGGWGADQ